MNKYLNLLHRYINHARHNPNLLLKQPVMIGQKLRIGFVAKRTIQREEELFFNYCIKDKEIGWLDADAKKIATTLQDGMYKTSLYVCVLNFVKM